MISFYEMYEINPSGYRETGYYLLSKKGKEQYGQYLMVQRRLIHTILHESKLALFHYEVSDSVEIYILGVCEEYTSIAMTFP